MCQQIPLLQYSPKISAYKNMKVTPMPRPEIKSNSKDQKSPMEHDLLSSQHSKAVKSYLLPRVLPVSNITNIRSRYLQQLGIRLPALSVSQSIPSLIRPNYRPAPVALSEPLKKDYGEKDEDISSSPMPLSKSAPITRSFLVSTPRKTRGVSFDHSVIVHQIPMRNEYSTRIRKQLWSDRTEIQRNASRNSYEFAAENWDWRQVAEDKDMIQAVTGELIHPIHYIQHCNLQRQFFLVMSARCMQTSH